MKELQRISIVVPLYNEQENVAPFHASLYALLQGTADVEIVYVNDGSSDETLSQLCQLLSADPRVKIVDLARNFGQTAAMSAGIAHSSGEILVFLDGDMQNDPQDIPALLQKLAEGFDVVSGWRQHRQDASLSRKLPSWLANRLLAKVTGLPLHDFGCTLKAYRRSVFTNLHLYGEMHRLIPAYALLNGAKIAEIPVTHHPRLFGVSKYGLSRTIRVLLDLLIFSFRARFSAKPMYAFGYIALFWIFLGLFQLLPFSARGRSSQIGSPFHSALCCFTTGSLCLLLGLLSEQNMRIYYEARCAFPYIVRAVHCSEELPFSAINEELLSIEF
jgi:glycosyltransferase involved in cell wall biosynthesis